MCKNCEDQLVADIKDGAVSRRAAVATLGTGAGVLALSGCGSSMDAGASARSVDPAAPTQSTDMAATSDVPVGGVIKASADGFTAMISQPTEGSFRAFSSVCTHQGCQLNAQKEKSINCPCHASVFSIEDGSPTGGPAETALAEFTVEVKEGRVWVG